MKYTYPEDEFDRTGQSDGHRGVHRMPRSTWSKVWPFLVVLVAFPVLAYVGVNTIGGQSHTAAAPPAAAGKVDGKQSAPPNQAAPGEAKPAAPPANPDAKPDLATAITVYNGTKISGLAAAGKDKLTGLGYASVKPANYAGTTLKESAVYYKGKEHEATAQAVAKALDITTVTADDGIMAREGFTDTPIVVLLQKDFRSKG